jgi:hypothetical protein
MQDAVAIETFRIAVAKLKRFIATRRGTGRDGGTAHRSIIQKNFGFYRRVAA